MLSDFNNIPKNDIRLRRIGAGALFMMPLFYVCMFVIYGVILSIPQTDIVNDKIAYLAANKEIINIANMIGYLVTMDEDFCNALLVYGIWPLQ